MCERMPMIGKGNGDGAEDESLVSAVVSTSGQWVHLHSPKLGNELVTDHCIREEDSLWKDPELLLGWIFPFSPFPRGVGGDALVCRAQGGCNGFGELNEQRAANPPPSPHLSAEDPLCVLSGTHLSEQWWGNNPLKVILLKISLLCKWDKEQMQRLSSPGLTQGTRASGGFSLSHGTGEESKACAVLGVQILCWVTPVLFRELDKSWGLCIWISACLQPEL